MPNKHVSPHDSLIGFAGRLLRDLKHPKTISALWERIREGEETKSFDRFVLAVDLLFMLGALEFRDGQLRRVRAR